MQTEIERTRKQIIDAYCKIRTIDNTIPDDVLDFMKHSALEKLSSPPVEQTVDAGQLEKVIGWREFTDDNDVDAYEKEVLWKNKKTGTVFIKAYYPYDPNLPLINDYQWMPIPA